MWRGLSGSDDLAWAGIMCCFGFKLTQNKDFIYHNKKINGVRGAVPIFKEIASHYPLDGNKGVYWDYNKTYIASISVNTTIYLAGLLFELTHDKQYLSFATEQLHWFVFESGLVNDEGAVRDGIKPGFIEPNVWTYNQGLCLCAISQLYPFIEDVRTKE